MPTSVTRRAAIVLAVLGAGSASAWAGKTYFNPSVGVEAGYNDNVGLDSGTPADDTVVGLTADLPVDHGWRKGALAFRYRLDLLRYQDFDELDRDEHRVDFDARSKSDRSTEWRFDAGFRRTQVQGFSGSIDASDFFLTERSDRDLYRAEFELESALAERWNWGFTVDGAVDHFRPIADFTVDTAPEDRRQYGASLGFARELSRKSSLGLEYTFRAFDLDISGDEQTHAVNAVYRRDISERLRYELSAGGFHGRGEAAGPDEERSGFDGSFLLTREYQKMRFEVNVLHGPTSLGSVRGSSTSSVAGVNLRSYGTRYWTWEVSPRLAAQEPTDELSEEIRSASLGGRVERAFARVMRVRLEANAIAQDSDDPEEDVNNFVTSLALLWFPLGSTNLAER